MSQPYTPMPSFHHEGFDTSNPGLKLKSDRLIVKVESLVQDSSETKTFPHASNEQFFALVELMMDLLYRPSIYDQLKTELAFDPEI